MSYFDKAFKIIIGHEGGYQNDPDDRGNWTGGAVGKGELRGTKYGISAASYPTADIKNLQLWDAHRVYKRDFWDRIYGDFLPPALALVAFDTAVNSGVNKAREILYGNHGIDKYMDARAAYVEQLINNPRYKKYADGWRNRLARLHTQAAEWEKEYGNKAILEFVYPVLPYNEYVVWEGGHFLDPEYLRYEKAQHTGTDYNGRGGGNTDWGDGVFAVADGVVDEVEFYPTIGGHISIKHTDELYSIYWHVEKIRVKVGDKVRMGQPIAVIGRGQDKNKDGAGDFTAHLHFELRRKKLPGNEWPSLTMSDKAAADYIASNRFNSETFFKAVGAGKYRPGISASDIPALPPNKTK